MTQEVKKKRGGVRKKAAAGTRPRRSDFAHPYLEPSVALGRRKDEVEDVASYTHKLSPDEKAWLNQFMKEYNDADMTGSVFHTTPEERKICYDRNNARNRCDYTLAASKNMLNLIADDAEMERIIYNGEVDIEEFEGD